MASIVAAKLSMAAIVADEYSVGVSKKILASRRRNQ